MLDVGYHEALSVSVKTKNNRFVTFRALQSVWKLSLCCGSCPIPSTHPRLPVPMVSNQAKRIIFLTTISALSHDLHRWNVTKVLDSRWRFYIDPIIRINRIFHLPQSIPHHNSVNPEEDSYLELLTRWWNFLQLYTPPRLQEKKTGRKRWWCACHTLHTPHQLYRSTQLVYVHSRYAQLHNFFPSTHTVCSLLSRPQKLKICKKKKPQEK